MVKHREILRLHAAGIGMQNIAFSRGCSKTTDKNVVGKARARGLEWPLPEEMGDTAIKSALFPAKPKGDADKAEIDHESVAREMARPAPA